MNLHDRFWHHILCSCYGAAFGAQICGQWNSRGRPDMQSAHACACFGEVAFFQEIRENVLKSSNKGAILDSTLARKSIKNAQNWCLGHPGSDIEGKGAIWDAKWRGKERLGVQNGGKNERFGSTVAGTALAHWIVPLCCITTLRTILAPSATASMRPIKLQIHLCSKVHLKLDCAH